jgi:MFS family permease
VIVQLYGTDAAMLFAAFLAVLSWIFFNGITVPSFENSTQATAGNASLGKSFSAMLKNQKISIILISNVLSGKLMLAGLLFYLTPLLLLEFQFTQVSIGQFFMFYYVSLTLCNVLLARYMTSTQARTPLMILGALLSGVGVLALIWFNKPHALAFAIVCLGVGQSAVLTLAPAILLTITRTELPHVNISHTLSLIRTFDRIGGILGAAFAATFSLLIDYRDAAIGLGLVVLTLVFANAGLALRSNRVK